MTSTIKLKYDPGIAVIMTICLLWMTGCSRAYYGVMEKVGIQKRDILVDRVGNAIDAQTEAQAQFKDALKQFGSVINWDDTELKDAYEKLNGKYKESNAAAKKVSGRIRKVESVANDLFAEWEKELELYTNQALRTNSARKLEETRTGYKEMLASMQKAEKNMEPILEIFHDNVLYLKHHPDAETIGSLQIEITGLKVKLEDLIRSTNDAIAQSNRFIKALEQ